VVLVQQINPDDEAAFDDWFAVLQATDRERWPDKPGWRRQERLVWALDVDGPEEHRCLSAYSDDGRVVGMADFEMFRRENLHLARLDVRVLPEARRQGVGRALVGAAERIAAESGRRELAAWTRHRCEPAT
jgi:GNAT superfamily N-acetyltransferase